MGSEIRCQFKQNGVQQTVRKGTAIKTKAERIVPQIDGELGGNRFSRSRLPPIQCWHWGFPCSETLGPALAAHCRRIMENSAIIPGHSPLRGSVALVGCRN